MIDVHQLTTQIVFATFTVIIFLLITIKQKPKQWPVVPGGLPFLGQVLALANTDKFLSVLTKWAEEMGQGNGIYEFFIFGKRWIVLCNAETIMEVMKLRPYKMRRATMIEKAIDSLGFGGVFSAEGHQWKQERRIVAPALNRNNIVDYFQAIKVVANRLITKWKTKEIVVANKDVSSSALDIIALAILGIDFDSLNNPNSLVSSDIFAVFEIVMLRVMSPVPYWKIPIIGQSLDGGKYHSERVLETIKGLIKDFRQRVAKNEQTGEKKTFLEKALALEEDSILEEERMIGNLAILIFGGTDTSSNTLSFCLWELAHDQDLQDEVYTEEIAKSGKGLDDVGMDDVLGSFPRLRSFLWEILRVRGPAPFLFFEPTEKIEFHGESILPGTIFCALTRSHGEKANSEVPEGPNGEGPEQFCPRRYLVPNDKASQDDGPSVVLPSNKFGGFMPFGFGLRSCPGKQFAEVEILTILFSILKTFKVEAMKDHPPIKCVSRTTETFDKDIRLSLKQRCQA
mmetsp:Transcript_21732/g.32982  ORF Transcript_21732/g.32982 Transcript_21732/m.32982 type:complete len:512 (+) Transcript_21732:45-1580(+)